MSDLSKLRIIYAEDENDLRKILSMVFEDSGIQAVTVDNGVDAYSAYEKESENIHGAILDVKMPGMDGIQVFQKISEQDPNFRVIFITGYIVEEGLQELVKANEDRVKVVRKPFDLDAMLELVGDFFVTE